MLSRVHALLHEIDDLDNFMKFVHHMADLDDVWKLRVNFVFVNCCSYVTLYLVIRGRDWKLHVSSLKQIAPSFAAFDCDIYVRIIPNQLISSKNSAVFENIQTMSSFINYSMCRIATGAL